MTQFWIVTISCIIFSKVAEGQDVDLSFPENFTIGAAASSHQIEGAWNVSDKGENIWDRFTHSNPRLIAIGSNGDVATNFYYKYKEDVQLMKSLGVYTFDHWVISSNRSSGCWDCKYNLDFYRFSISWSRVLPTGLTNKISQEGIQFYKNLTAELVANDIEPVVTLYHFDHPQILEEYGGWTNELMVDWFVSFAAIMFEALGDNVKIWTTLNEPRLYCTYAYEAAYLAPGKKLTGIGKYLCVHNMLKAHAKAYHMYDKNFRATQQGEIGIVDQCTSFIAASSSDTESVETAFQFECGWTFNPIFNGDYPEIMKTRIAMISEAQGYEGSRLPQFSKEWISLINGTYDYIGLNYYTSEIVTPDLDEALGIYNSDNGLIRSVNSSWPTTVLRGICVTPSGFGDMLRRIRDKYNNPPVRVMENGYSDYGNLEDYNRIRFHYDHVKELLKAVKQDNCNVRSYAIWSIMDNFEWGYGYGPKFGIISVDFDDIDRPRTGKLSASWWKSVLKNRELQPVPTISDP